MRSLGRCFPLYLTVVFFSCSAPNPGIHQAASDGDLDTVRRLVEGDSELLGATDEDSRTPLHFAVGQGHPEVVDFLLSQGADIDAGDRGGEAPLHLAVRNASPEMVNLLLGHHPSVDVTNGRGRTPLHLVARETGSAELATMLLDAGAEVNLLDRYGDPPLGLAAWRGFEEMVNVFLDRGAEIPADPGELGTLATFSAQHGLERLFGRVVGLGADLSGTNDGGGTLLHSAAVGGSGEVVEILLTEGLDAGGLDRYGWTPLHYAAAEGHSEVVEVLLSKGADAEVRTLAGDSPLSLATQSGRPVPAGLSSSAGPEFATPAFPYLEGPFFGESPPGEEVTLFAADMVSSNRFEHGSVTFTADGTEAFWSSSFIVDDSGYSRGRIMTSRLTEEGWLAPDFASFSTDFYSGDDVPFFHPDGNRLFFSSGRTDDPSGEHLGERIWYVDRTGSGWSEPILVQGGPNELDKHWQFAVAGNGNIYFSSGAVGGLGSGDLYVSRYEGGVWMTPENLGAPVNTEHQEFSPFIAPDESYLIYSLNGSPENLGTIDLWISFREGGGWAPPVSLGPSVNSRFHDLCPMISADGRHLFFNSHRGGQADIFWVDAAIIEELRPH